MNKTTLLHNCGNTWEVRLNDFFSEKSHCPFCANSDKRSRVEKELADLIKNNYNGQIITNDRIILDGKEIDVYLPDLKIGIEFCGIYWHSDKFKDNSYHLNKKNLANSKGVRLIQIASDEWYNSEEIVKSKILTIINAKKSTKIIGARKCFIKEIDSSEKNIFLEKNHIQGKDRAEIKLGMFYQEELVAVFTLVKNFRSKNSHKEYELSRFATTIEYSVPGAFSKMLKYVERNYDISKINTFADLRWSDENNNIYINNGFIFLYNTLPNYWYSRNGSERLHRFGFRKGVLKDKFPDFYDENKTEKEIMKNAGYYRFYDCGNAKFEWNKENKIINE